MVDAKEAVQQLLAEARDYEKQVFVLTEQLDKLKVENEVLRERLKELEPFENLVLEMPETISVTLEKEVAVKVMDIAINLYGSSANPNRVHSSEAKNRALKKIDFVVNKMIEYVCRKKPRIHHFLMEEKLILGGNDAEES